MNAYRCPKGWHKLSIYNDNFYYGLTEFSGYCIICGTKMKKISECEVKRFGFSHFDVIKNSFFFPRFSQFRCRYCGEDNWYFDKKMSSEDEKIFYCKTCSGGVKAIKSIYNSKKCNITFQYTGERILSNYFGKIVKL